MKLFNVLPESRISAPGLERVLLKKLPKLLLAGTVIPILVSFSGRFFPPGGTAAQVEAYLTQLDIVSLATGIIVWMTGLTIAIACLMVVLMKGPAYVADAYPLRDNERPLRRRR